MRQKRDLLICVFMGVLRALSWRGFKGKLGFSISVGTVLGLVYTE